MAKLFISYSHADETLKDKLEKHLTMLRRQEIIEPWSDRMMNVGAHIDETVLQKLEEADVVLLLVSADFLASEYCYSKEMKRAVERHRQGECMVIPVILRPCDWHPAPFGKLLAAPKDGLAVTTWANQDEALTDVARQVRRAVEELGSAANKAANSPVHKSSSKQEVARPSTRPANSRSASIGRLNLKKEFTDFDRDQFLHDSFEHIAAFFANSLAAVEAENEGVQTRFRRIDANRFSSVIYRNGRSATECSVKLANFGSRNDCISFSYDASAPMNSSNEMLNIEHDDSSMYLKPFGMQHFSSQPNQKMSAEDAAKYLWDLLVSQLGR